MRCTQPPFVRGILFTVQRPSCSGIYFNRASAGGGVLYELAIILPFLLILMTAFPSVGSIISEQQKLSEAALAGARLGAMTSTDSCLTAYDAVRTILVAAQLDPDHYVYNIQTEAVVLPNGEERSMLQVFVGKRQAGRRDGTASCVKSSYITDNYSECSSAINLHGQCL